MNDPVITQMHAYNTQDLDAFCACCHDEILIEDGNGVVLSSGMDTLRARYASMFAQHPSHRAELVARMCIGPWVIDEERVTGRGAEPLRAVAIYRVLGGKIASVRLLSDGD
jgi:hypothetical protein